METPAVIGRWTRVRTLGRGASGAEVFLAAAEASGRLFAVKSVPERGAAALMREKEVMAGLRSPHVVPCFGGRACLDGSYQLFLEFAPGGSLADEAGRLEERDVRRYAADVARGLAYVHGAGLVHGDVKPRNVVLGADGRAKLADFGCARRAAVASRAPMIGFTPAFMAPEVARGEEQGPAADVWALGCTVIEMATGRAPWSHLDDVLAAVRVIGYTDAVPEVPRWLSAEAKDFLDMCLARRPSDRPTASELLEHPFLASATAASSKGKLWVSPKGPLDAAFWESDSDEDEDYEVAQSAVARINALACSVSTLPVWDSDEGWIDVTSTPSESSSDAVPVPAEGKTGVSTEEEWNNAVVEPLDIDVDRSESARNSGETDASPEHEGHPHSNLLLVLACDEEVPCKLVLQCSNNRNHAMDFVLAQMPLCSIPVTNFRRKLSFTFIKVLSVSCSGVVTANTLEFTALRTGAEQFEGMITDCCFS